jgi:hypothetical protein
MSVIIKLGKRERPGIIVSGAIALAFLIIAILSPGLARAYICGDANGDESFDVGDVVSMIDFVFRGGLPPEPMERADANGDCISNIGDAVYMINNIFKEGPAAICPRCSFTSNIGSCKSITRGDSIPQNLDCIEYQYDGAGTLHISHINAGLNCCPSGVNLTVIINDGNLIITEKELLDMGGCDCYCLFDIEYTLEDIPPGYYMMKVIGECLHGQDPLQVIVDFSEPRTGTHCVERYLHPWGL